jgi:transglutaminase-like putative cysteine protease
MSQSDPSSPGVAAPGVGDRRVVSCDLSFSVAEPAELVLQVTASDSVGSVTAERLDARSEGEPVVATELLGPHGTRSHVVRAPVGRLTVAYRAEIDVGSSSRGARDRAGSPVPGDAGGRAAADPSVSHSRLVYLRPSRYCPSDHLVGFAVAEFGVDSSVDARVRAITEWIRQRVGYVAGSSSVHDSAEHTLLTGVGTCRDFAHLGVALCRAVGIPARFSSVYAPGLFPMDFHAVFEFMEDGRWYSCDATDLAPRPAMVRIATGRDAADAAFAAVLAGIATLDHLEVTATVGDHLPVDDRNQRVELA